MDTNLDLSSLIHKDSLENLNTRPVVTIHKKSIENNYKLLKDLSSPAVCSAVVKNNAYGLGSKFIVETLYQAGCRIFWVAHAIEAIEVHNFNHIEPSNIFVIQGFGSDTLDIFLQYKFIPVINSLEQVFLWKNHQQQLPKPIIHIDTGLNRLGLTKNDFKYCVDKKILDNNNIRLIMSHLACADTVDHFMNQFQYANFLQSSNLLPKVSRTLSASDGVMLGKNYNFDLVRCGAALYGINTSPYRENKMHPVLTVHAPILQIKSLKPGEYVGYGATFRTHQPKKIAILAIGYGDGLPCSLKNVGCSFIDGYAAPYAGRVSMDALTIDVTNVPEDLLHTGKMVSIINDIYTVDDMANNANTIGYEILCNFARRSGRVKVMYC